MSRDDAEFFSWLETILNEPEGTLSMTTNLEELLGWDSMGMLLLMADLDEMYAIQMTEERLEELVTVRDIANLIDSSGGG